MLIVNYKNKIGECTTSEGAKCIIYKANCYFGAIMYEYISESTKEEMVELISWFNDVQHFKSMFGINLNYEKKLVNEFNNWTFKLDKTKVSETIINNIKKVCNVEIY